MLNLPVTSSILLLSLGLILNPIRTDSPPLKAQNPVSPVFTESSSGCWDPVDFATLPPDAILVGDPKTIAIALFGSSEIAPAPEAPRQTVTVIEPTEDSPLIVLLEESGLPDDSVAAIRYRLEFTPARDSDHLWQLSWAGRQYICRQGRGQQDWHHQLCR